MHDQNAKLLRKSYSLASRKSGKYKGVLTFLRGMVHLGLLNMHTSLPGTCFHGLCCNV